MIISYDFGHGVGADRGAEGILNEEKCIREYGTVVVNELIRQGHILINCTPTDPNMTLMQSLQYRVDKANACGSQLHICFHVNASGVGGHGEEIEVASDTGLKYAQPVFNEICKLGFTPRDINRPNLYITAHTTMPAILLEPFFCDVKVDCDLYNPNTLGLAIATGIIATIGGNVKPMIPTSFIIPTDNDIAPVGANITPFKGIGWHEYVPIDGRSIWHKSKSQYLSQCQDGKLLYTFNGVTKEVVLK